MTATFDLKMFHPKERLSTQVQAVWSASVSSQGSNNIKKWLHCDACSGILFNLRGGVYLNNTLFTAKVIMLPVSKHAQLMTLPPGSQLVGIRFHPAVSFAVLGMHYDQPTAIQLDDAQPLFLQTLYHQLDNSQGHYARIMTLYRWLHHTISATEALPTPLLKTLNAIQSKTTPGELINYVSLSQRQIERQFQKWMSMTPKYYQRILRVKNTLHFLKDNPEAELADVALNKGFTDQAHMTREFKHIARTTPKKYCKQA